MMKKLIGIVICMLLISTVLPVSGTVLLEKSSIPSTVSSQQPILEVEIETYNGVFIVPIHVRNIGDQPAHNVTISDTSFEGIVVFNHRDLPVDDELLPGELSWSSVGIFLGFRRFTVTITVTCDEGVSDTTSANGFALFIWCYIP
ncbi:MAG: hypothetical protein KAQ84_04540 [Thermoplasmatales archaeon]|nr:hypothetical protein [Thermoplasmatales archaeon]